MFIFSESSPSRQQREGGGWAGGWVDRRGGGGEPHGRAGSSLVQAVVLKIWEVKDLVQDELIFCEEMGMVLQPRTETERERKGERGEVG